MQRVESEDLASRKSSIADDTNEVTSAEVDETIAMSLRAVVHGADGSEFADELTGWVRAELVTAEGIAITRDEFRRRLEALKACYAGRAVQLHVSEAVDRLDVLVCNRLL